MKARSIWKQRATGTPGGMVADATELRRGLALFADPNATCELVALTTGAKRRVLGADIDGLVAAAHELPGGIGLYMRVNPVKPGAGESTNNPDILKRRWLYIDVDPLKAAGQESNPAMDEEKEDSRGVADSVRSYLSGCGFPAPVIVDSGNGCALLYRIDLPNDPAAAALCKRFLHELAERFADEPGKIDKAVHNANRLMKVPGTWARKGTQTDDRPYRQTRILFAPATCEVVPAELIAAVAAQKGKPEAANPTPPFASNGSPFKQRTTSGDGSKAAYSRKALDSECAKLALAQPGERNNVLNTAAFNLGTLAGAGLLDDNTIESALYVVALSIGLDEGEILPTIRSGLNAGRLKPREIQEKAKKEEAKGSAAETVPAGETIIEWASDIVPRKVEFLWPGRIPLGKLTTFAGQTGQGKTFTLCDIAARVTTGAEWPDGTGKATPGKVLFISGEDWADDTLVPRVAEAGADLSKIAFLRPKVLGQFTLADLPALDRALKEMGQGVRYVAIDPPTAFLGEVNDHRNAELRGLLHPLQLWASQNALAVVFVTHVSKPGAVKVDALMRVMGSVAWVNAVRAAHMFCADPENKEKSLMACLKINNAPKPKAMAYQLIFKPNEMARIEWLGEVDTTADEALNHTPPRERRDVAASEWLIEKFREKRVWDSDDLFREAKAENVSRNAIYEAKKMLNLPKARKVVLENGDTKWTWWVPDDWEQLSRNSPEIVPTGTVGTVDEKAF